MNLQSFFAQTLQHARRSFKKNKTQCNVPGLPERLVKFTKQTFRSTLLVVVIRKPRHAQGARYMCPPFLKNEVRVRVDPCLRRTQHRDHPPSFNDGFCHSTRLVCFVNLRARVRGSVSSAVATLKRCHAPIFWKSKNFAAA